MRIDFIITELFAGGAERCLTELAIGLSERGESVRVFSIGSLPKGDARMLVDRLERSGIEVCSAESDSLSGTRRAMKGLRRWLQQDKPQVCQTFLYHANVLGTLAAKAAGVPVRVGGIRVAEVNRLRCMIERAAVKRMTSVVSVSRGVEEFAKKQLLTQGICSVVIPNGVDVTRFEQCRAIDWSTLGWPKDADVCLYVGRIHHQKGIDLLQRKIDTIAPSDTNRRLLLIGEGPLADPIRVWAEQIGGDRVQSLPWQPDVAAWIAASRLLVLPSRYEGMPNVVLEAMAAGKPVVCSRVEGTDELFEHDLDSQTFPVEDLDAMGGRIESLLNDPAKCRRIGAANRQHVGDRFSVASMVEAYQSHYRRLLNSRPAVE